MTIGEVAKEAGLRASAIRFYEKSGLLPRPVRSSGQRRYDRSILARLAVLKRAKDCGFTLDEARQLFNDHGRPRERWERVAVTKMAELDELMQKIAAMKNLLEKRCQCADLEECGRKLLEARGGKLALA
jgi:MerR family transcriptional regulator, redox-sensitive transcriptional activator SoxR